MFDGLANDPELHLKMRLRPGDMQFDCNHSQLHDRTGYTDWPEPENFPHQFLLWLSLAATGYCRKASSSVMEPSHWAAAGGIITPRIHLHAPPN